jgi:dihydropyrimidinase
MERRGVTSFKAYMAYDALRLSDAEIGALFAAARDIGYVGVHCELGDEVDRGVALALAAGHTGPAYHPLSRPNRVESEAVRRCLELAGKAGAPAWIVHLSTKKACPRSKKPAGADRPCWWRPVPQYLTLTDEVYRLGGFEAAKFVCSPPIRSREDQEALWGALSDQKLT